MVTTQIVATNIQISFQRIQQSIFKSFKAAVNWTNSQCNIFCVILSYISCMSLMPHKTFCSGLMTKEKNSYWVLAVLITPYPSQLELNWRPDDPSFQTEVSISATSCLERMYLLSKHKQSTQVNNVFDSPSDVATS